MYNIIYFYHFTISVIKKNKYNKYVIIRIIVKKICMCIKHMMGTTNGDPLDWYEVCVK